MKKSKLRTLIVWILLLLLFFVAWKSFQDKQGEKQLAARKFDSFLSDAKAGRVSRVAVLEPGVLEVQLRTGTSYLTLGDLDGESLNDLTRSRTAIEWTGGRHESDVSYTPILIILGGVAALLFFFYRRSQGQVKGALSFGKSKARLLPESSACSFAEVGGCAEAKQALSDVVDFLKNPQSWKAAGARPPRGVLLEGQPGCGKTLLARAVAGEAKARFFFLSASEFVEMFVGVGAARVRDTFETAAKEAPSILFIDELDALARRRGSGIGGSHDEREQTLNQLLVCLDGMHRYDRVVVLAATNRSDILDTALLRPGRFDVRIHLEKPSRPDRLEILGIHLRHKPVAPGITPEALADMTEGMTGAEIEGISNSAAVLSIRRVRANGNGSPQITVEDFRQAIEVHKRRGGTFDSLDSLLIGSASQALEPTGRAMARLQMVDGSVVSGEVIWANSEFVKIREREADGVRIVPKSQVKALWALDGTTAVNPEEARGDPWAASSPGAA